MDIESINITDLKEGEQDESRNNNMDLSKDVIQEVTALVQAAASLLPYSRIYFDDLSDVRIVTVNNITFEVEFEQFDQFGFHLEIKNDSKRLLYIVYSTPKGRWEGFGDDKWRLPVFDELLLLIKLNAFDMKKQLKYQEGTPLYSNTIEL